MEESSPRDRLDAVATGFMEAKLLLTGAELHLFDSAGKIAAWGEAAGLVCDGWDHLGPPSCLITLRRRGASE